MDFSPEEIRLEAYTANSKGNANAYVSEGYIAFWTYK